MSKRAPSTTQLLIITAFALACFGILLFLWVTFGGPTPFKAKSYQIKVPFTEASQLAEQSDVRISGVDVGKVENIELGPGGKEAVALLNAFSYDDFDPAAVQARMQDLDDQRAIVARAVCAVVVEGPLAVAAGAQGAAEAVEHIAGRLRDWVA